MLNVLNALAIKQGKPFIKKKPCRAWAVRRRRDETQMVRSWLMINRVSGSACLRQPGRYTQPNPAPRLMVVELTRWPPLCSSLLVQSQRTQPQHLTKEAKTRRLEYSSLVHEARAYSIFLNCVTAFVGCVLQTAIKWSETVARVMRSREEKKTHRERDRRRVLSRADPERPSFCLSSIVFRIYSSCATL